MSKQVYALKNALKFATNLAKTNHKNQITHCIYCNKLLNNRQLGRNKFCNKICHNLMLKHIRLNSLLIMSNGDQIDITYNQAIKLKQQITHCEICNKKLDYEHNSKDIYIDHCHKTKKFRGVLCIGCNRMLGWVENVNNIQTPEEYLKGYEFNA